VDLTDYLRILRSRWLIVFATVVVAVVAAWATFSVAKVGSPTRSYQASTVLLNTDQTGGLALQTVASLAKIEPVAQAVAQNVGYTGKPLDLADRISVVVADENATTLRITATSQASGDARHLADAWTTELIDYLNDRKLASATARAEAIQEQLDLLTDDIASLQRQIAATPDSQDDQVEAQLAGVSSLFGGLYQQQQSALSEGLEPVGLEIVQHAISVPVATSVFQAPNSLIARMVIGLVIGLLLGAGLAILVERTRSPIRTKQAAEQYFGYPVIGEVPRSGSQRRRETVMTARPQSRAAHAFRLLAATLTRLGSNDHPGEYRDRTRRIQGSQTILVTSAGPSEGKTTVVANLSAALADLGRRTLVMSCDFHRPFVHQYFGVPGEPGLSDGLASSNGQGILEGRVWASSIEKVAVVPSGRRPAKPGELLSSGQMRRALQEARELADVVILDTAPLLAEGDTAHLLSAIDDVLVVARAGKTSQDVAQRAHEFLERLGAHVIGVVLTDAAESTVPRRYYGYAFPDDGGVETEPESEPKPVGNRAPEAGDVGDNPDSRDTGGRSSV
jgi:capsular exopolysaccharide synthesis family protein